MKGYAFLFLLCSVGRSTSARVFLALLYLYAPLTGQSQVVLDVACFRGGYGIDFYQERARDFERLHPGVKIQISGSPRIWDQLTPRFAAGTPPDLCYPGWGMNVFSLIFDGHLLPLNPYLDQPAIGWDRKWGETFIPSLLNKGSYQGKIYTLPYNFDTFGWWYNRRIFEKHGWAPPRNYGELLTLCGKMKAAGIAPITFAGRYPQYMLDGLFLPWAHSAGGQEPLTRVDKLEPGAWLDPAFLRAAETLLELKRLGYFQPGCIGMNHTESQMEFLVGRAAMIPNGTWLYSEMKKLLPPGFEMEFILCPPFEKGIGDPTAIKGTYDGKGWCIPAKSKHPDVAADFLRYLTSAEVAQKFMHTKGTLMALTDLDETRVPAHLRGPLRIVRAARTEWNVDYAEWYPELGSEVQNAVRDLYNGLHTPREFLERLERQSEAMRNDPRLRRFGSK